MFSRSEQALQSHFAEIRTNILLDAGFHHPRYERGGSSRLGLFRNLTKSKRIRITFNHIQYITKFIRNSIQNRSPDGACFPRNEQELADQKSAELNQSVYLWLKDEYKLTQLYAQLIKDFVVQGETHTKVFWDPRGGKLKGYDGEGDPVWKGGIIYERVPSYNFLTDPDADSERTNYWVCIRKYFPRKKLLERYKSDEKAHEIIEKSSKEKTNWFDAFTGIYSDAAEDEVELREFYFKPCDEYPEGYWIFATDQGILEEGELPDGFCIFSEVFDESPENPRGYSIIKQAKPFQVEINRCAAAAITESIVLGHTTILYPAGEKPSSSGIGNGIKGLQYHSVKEPTVVEGRTGNQYIDYADQKVQDMYRICGVPLWDEDKTQGVNDAQAMLGRSLKDKMRFSIYGEKIENLICNVMDYSLKLSRRYLPDDEVIPIVGKTEAVNIPEFRNTSPSNYELQIQPRADDFTSVYGKSLQITQALQYVGSQLPPEAIASLVGKLPFLNKEAIMKDFRIWERQADAMILTLDRGQIPFFFERTNHNYMVDRLTLRMNENDFPALPQEVQLNYLERYDAHIQVLTQQQKEEAAATAGFIPSGGGAVSVDFYIQTPEGKQQRARLPYESVSWLIERLKQQGTEVEKITNLPNAAQADLGRSNAQAGVSTDPQALPPQGNVLPFTG